MFILQGKNGSIEKAEESFQSLSQPTNYGYTTMSIDFYLKSYLILFAC